MSSHEEHIEALDSGALKCSDSGERPQATAPPTPPKSLRVGTITHFIILNILFLFNFYLIKCY